MWLETEPTDASNHLHKGVQVDAWPGQILRPHSGKSEVYMCPIASHLQRRIAVSVPGLIEKHVRIVRYSKVVGL